MKFPTVPFVIITSLIVSTILVFSLFPGLSEIRENWEGIRVQMKEEYFQAGMGIFEERNDYDRVDPNKFRLR